MAKYEDPLIRFWAKVNKNGPTMPHMKTKCWVWTAALHPDQYGAFNAGKKIIVLAHRWIYQQLHNVILPPEIVVMHKCDNPPCVRDSHLHQGSQDENNTDRVLKNRTAHNPGKRGSTNSKAILTEADIPVIRQLWDTGDYIMKDIGKLFGVSPAAILKVLHRKSWQHVL